MSRYANVRQIMLGQKRTCKCPLLGKFVKKCLRPKRGSFLPMEDIFQGYVAAVALWTDNDSVNGQTSFLMKEKAFHRQFRKAVQTGHRELGPVKFSKENGNGRRGLEGFELTRPRREEPLNIEGEAMAQRVRDYVLLDTPPDPPIELHEVPSDRQRQAGFCAFASRDIERGEIVCEYEGQIVTIEEADERETQYANDNLTCTLMVIECAGEQIAIDPHAGAVRNQTPARTWGSAINHSRHHANLKPLVMGRNSGNPRVFLVAGIDIPQTVELLWNYNDPDWELHNNSQTIPLQL